ncbi:MAG: FeS cluster assembly protein SufD [Candidatus Anoxychlamydiales bacterium]|nr:FeS cluster assembly protein SufD [Candidatus Anoxychlamydiales bacterium]
MSEKLKELDSFVKNRKSWQDFLNTNFPSNKVEEYKYLDLRFLSNRDLQPIEDNFDIDKLDINSLKRLFFDENEFYNLIFINGKFFENFSNLPKALKINKLQNISNEKIALKNLNLSFNFDSLEFNFTKSIEKPIAFIHINTNLDKKITKKSIYTNYRISLFKDVKISMIDKFVNSEKNDFFNNNIIDIFLDKNAYLDHYILQESKDNLQFNHYKVDLEDKAVYRGFLLNQKSKISRFDFEINLNKIDSDAQINGIYLGKKDQILDHYIKTNHNFEKTFSFHYLKGILKDESKGIFYASTIVKKGVKKIIGNQLNKNILLDNEASCFSRPELWIKADDVKCSHGSTTGQLDKDAIFYLQSRGFSLKKAKEILLKAFIDEIFEKIDNENIKKLIKKII